MSNLSPAQALTTGFKGKEAEIFTKAKHNYGVWPDSTWLYGYIHGYEPWIRQRHGPSWGHTLWLHMALARVSVSLNLDPVVAQNPLPRDTQQVQVTQPGSQFPFATFPQVPTYQQALIGRGKIWVGCTATARPRTWTGAHGCIASHASNYNTTKTTNKWMPSLRMCGQRDMQEGLPMTWQCIGTDGCHITFRWRAAGRWWCSGQHTTPTCWKLQTKELFMAQHRPGETIPSYSSGSSDSVLSSWYMYDMAKICLAASLSLPHWK